MDPLCACGYRRSQHSHADLLCPGGFDVVTLGHFRESDLLNNKQRKGPRPTGALFNESEAA